jgi:hypothetical protein
VLLPPVPLVLVVLPLLLLVLLVVVLLLPRRKTLSLAYLLVVGIGCVVCLSMSSRRRLLALHASSLMMALEALSASVRISHSLALLAREWMLRCWVLACGSSFSLPFFLLLHGVARQQRRRSPLDAGVS